MSGQSTPSRLLGLLGQTEAAPAMAQHSKASMSPEQLLDAVRELTQEQTAKLEKQMADMEDRLLSAMRRRHSHEDSPEDAYHTGVSYGPRLGPSSACTRFSPEAGASFHQPGPRTSFSDLGAAGSEAALRKSHMHHATALEVEQAEQQREAKKQEKFLHKHATEEIYGKSKEEFLVTQEQAKKHERQRSKAYLSQLNLYMMLMPSSVIRLTWDVRVPVTTRHGTRTQCPCHRARHSRLRQFCTAPHAR